MKIPSFFSWSWLKETINWVWTNLHACLFFSRSLPLRLLFCHFRALNRRQSPQLWCFHPLLAPWAILCSSPTTHLGLLPGAPDASDLHQMHLLRKDSRWWAMVLLLVLLTGLGWLHASLSKSRHLPTSLSPQLQTRLLREAGLLWRLYFNIQASCSTNHLFLAPLLVDLPGESQKTERLKEFGLGSQGQRLISHQSLVSGLINWVRKKFSLFFYV